MNGNATSSSVSPDAATSPARVTVARPPAPVKTPPVPLAANPVGKVSAQRPCGSLAVEPGTLGGGGGRVAVGAKVGGTVGGTGTAVFVAVGAVVAVAVGATVAVGGGGVAVGGTAVGGTFVAVAAGMVGEGDATALGAIVAATVGAEVGAMVGGTVAVGGGTVAVGVAPPNGPHAASPQTTSPARHIVASLFAAKSNRTSER